MIVKELFTFPEPNLSKYAKPIEYYINDNGCYICVSHTADKDGYRKLYRNSDYLRVHRYTYSLITSEVIDDRIICHDCDEPACCNPGHCKAGDHVLNMRHRAERNRTAIGEKNGNSKLTTEQVIEILEDDISTPKEIAAKYGVTSGNIREIKSGKRWKHVERKQIVKRCNPKMAPSKPSIPGTGKLGKTKTIIHKEKASNM